MADVDKLLRVPMLYKVFVVVHLYIGLLENGLTC